MTDPTPRTVRFRPIDIATAYALGPLRNRVEVQRHVRHPGLVTAEDQGMWFQWLMDHKETQLMLALEVPAVHSESTTVSGWRLVGCGGMTWISWPDRRAELSVYTVPISYEFEAAQLLLEHGFRGMGLNRIEAETLTPGRAELVHKLGFREEGDRCEAYWRDGGYVNAQRWGLLAMDWKAA